MAYPDRLGEDVCRTTLLEYIYQKDSHLYEPEGYRGDRHFPYTEMKVDELSEGCRHWINRGWTQQAYGRHPAGEAYENYVEFDRDSLIRQAARLGGDEPLEAYTKEQLDKINYKGYYHEPVDEYELDPIVTVDRNSIEVSDIINGRRVSRRYIGHTEDEALESFMEDAMTGGL